jgi:hypothetical protein
MGNLEGLRLRIEATDLIGGNILPNRFGTIPGPSTLSFLSLGRVEFVPEPGIRVATERSGEESL